MLEDDYYPFGLTFNSYQRENSVEQRWKFQGQEHIDDLGLNWDSFKWRNHQPDIGRFFNIDPLAESFYYNSPYAFSENKVTSHIELEGLEAVPFTDEIEGHGLTEVNNVNRSGNAVTYSKTIVNNDKPTTGTEVKISLASNVKQTSVSDHSVKVIGEVGFQSGEESLTINSSARTPEDQARVMYEKAEAEGAQSMKDLYAPPGDKVIEAYEGAKTVLSVFQMRDPEGVTKQIMTNTINELGPNSVSKHTSDPSQLQVFDIGPSSVQNQSRFRSAIDSNTGSGKPISNRIHPGGSEKAYHVEIPQIRR